MIPAILITNERFQIDPVCAIWCKCDYQIRLSIKCDIRHASKVSKRAFDLVLRRAITIPVQISLLRLDKDNRTSHQYTYSRHTGRKLQRRPVTMPVTESSLLLIIFKRTVLVSYTEVTISLKADNSQKSCGYHEHVNNIRLKPEKQW